MTPKSAQLRRLHHPAGISAHPAFTIASGQRGTLAVAGARQPSSPRTTGALALAPAFPIALTTGGPGTGLSPGPQLASDPSALWLRTAAAGLGVLAAAAAAVSFTAQYRMVNATRHLPAIAALEHATRHDVAIPDMIRQLPTAFALVIRSNCAPVITRLPQAWKNPAYRRARRLGHAPARHLAEAISHPALAQPGIPDHVPADWLPGGEDDDTAYPWN